MIELFVTCLLMLGAIAAANSVSHGIDAAVHPEKPVEHVEESAQSVGWSLVFGVLALIVAVILL